MRNLSIALAIAMTAFGSEGSEIALIIALAYIIQVQAAAGYVKFTDRLFGPAPDAQVKDVMLDGVFSLHGNDTIQNALRLLAEEHIHSCAVLDENEQPVGMLTIAVLLDALADGIETGTALHTLPLEPALLIPAKAPLKQALEQMRRAHEYKVLVPDADGKIEHVLTQEEIIRHFATHQINA
jgi:CBS-domain-containing membrane protein